MFRRRKKNLAENKKIENEISEQNITWGDEINGFCLITKPLAPPPPARRAPPPPARRALPPPARRALPPPAVDTYMRLLNSISRKEKKIKKAKGDGKPAQHITELIQDLEQSRKLLILKQKQKKLKEAIREFNSDELIKKLRQDLQKSRDSLTFKENEALKLEFEDELNNLVKA